MEASKESAADCSCVRRGEGDHLKLNLIVVAVRNMPPGGGGARIDATACRAALSSAALPDELVMEMTVGRPDGPMVKATPTDPLAPEARADSG